METTHLTIVLFDPVGPRLLEASATSLVSPQSDIRRLYIALGALALAAGPLIATICVKQFSSLPSTYIVQLTAPGKRFLVHPLVLMIFSIVLFPWRRLLM